MTTKKPAIRDITRSRIIPAKGEHGGYIVHPADRVVRSIETARTPIDELDGENPMDVPPRTPSAETDLLDVPGASKANGANGHIEVPPAGTTRWPGGVE